MMRASATSTPPRRRRFPPRVQSVEIIHQAVDFRVGRVDLPLNDGLLRFRFRGGKMFLQGQHGIDSSFAIRSCFTTSVFLGKCNPGDGQFSEIGRIQADLGKGVPIVLVEEFGIDDAKQILEGCMGMALRAEMIHA